MGEGGGTYGTCTAILILRRLVKFCGEKTEIECCYLFNLKSILITVVKLNLFQNCGLGEGIADAD